MIEIPQQLNGAASMALASTPLALSPRPINDETPGAGKTPGRYSNSAAHDAGSSSTYSEVRRPDATADSVEILPIQPRHSMALNGAEVWRTIPGFSAYEVSNVGRIQSSLTLSRHILTPRPNDGGYLRVFIRADDGKKRQLHISAAVLTAFVGPRPSPRHQAAHGFGGKTDNSLGNVRWATPEENWNDKRLHGTATVGDRNPMSLPNRLRRSRLPAPSPIGGGV